MKATSCVNKAGYLQQKVVDILLPSLCFKVVYLCTSMCGDFPLMYAKGQTRLCVHRRQRPAGGSQKIFGRPNVFN